MWLWGQRSARIKVVAARHWEDHPGKPVRMSDIEEDLAVMHKQLALAEHALESLRRDVKSDRTFRLYSEGYVDQILALQADITAYRRRQQAERRPAKRTKLLKRGIMPRR